MMLVYCCSFRMGEVWTRFWNLESRMHSDSGVLELLVHSVKSSALESRDRGTHSRVTVTAKQG